MSNSRMHLDLDRLAADFARNASVRECAIRPGEAGADSLTAYIAPNGKLPAAAFRDRIRSLLPAGLAGAAIEVVLLSAMPVTSAGGIDEHALAALRGLGSQAEDLEAALESIHGVAEAAVLVRYAESTVPRVHLADVASSGLRPRTERRPESHDGPHPASGRSVPALADGGPISDPRHRSGTLLTFLEQAAGRMDCGEMIFLDDTGDESRLSYRELAVEARRVLGGLRANGIARGDKVLLQLADNRSFVTALWGCMAGGVIAAPIPLAPSYETTNGAVRKLRAAWQLLGEPTILADESHASEIEQAHRLFGDSPYRILTIERLRAHTPQSAWEQVSPDDVCLMLLTSGSTGTPKVVPLTHRNVVCRSLGQAQKNGFDSSARVFNWFPMDHVGAVVMYHCLAVTLGATQVLAATEYVLKEPLRWLDVIERHRITDTWAPNFAFALVNDLANEVERRKWDLSSLQTLLNGGEAIVPRTARRFVELLAPHGLPEGAMLPAWGMSETSSGATCIRLCERPPAADSSFTCVGGPIPGVSLRIAGQDDSPAPIGAIGRVQIRGLSVFGGYYRNDEANASAFTQDGWFETGDLGALDDGVLTITGRTKEVIIVNGVNFYCHEIEAAAEQAPGVEVSFTAACAVRSPDCESDQLAVFFHPSGAEPAARLAAARAIRGLVTDQAGVTPDFILPVEREDIPKTAIGKIERGALRRRFEAGGFAEALHAVERELGGVNTMPACFFERVWMRKNAIHIASGLPAGRYVVFADRAGAGEAIRESLLREGREAVAVYPGESLRQTGPEAFEIDPESHAYEDLLALLRRHGPIDHVVHCWAYTAQAEPAADSAALRRQLFRSVYSLLGIVQALAARQGQGRQVTLTVVANRVQAVKDSDAIEPWKGAALGLIRTLALELPWIECRSIDVSKDGDASAVLAELTVIGGPTELAIRNGERWIPTLRAVDMASPASEPPPVRRGGTYVVTGGLGALGREVAKWLAADFDAKLLLIGRSELSAEGERHLRSIQSLGDALYVRADVSDRQALQRAIDEARARWSRDIDGVFHLAGEGNLVEHWSRLAERRVTAASIAHFESMLGAKVYGTQNLLRLLDSRPEALFVSFSSVNSLFGGATFGAYATANAYLDACAADRRENPRYFNLNWSMWDGLGMAEGNPEYARTAIQQIGFLILSREQAMASLRGAMARRRRGLIVGVDPSNPHVAPHFEGTVRLLEELAPFVRTNAGPDESAAMETARERCAIRGWRAAQRVGEWAIGANGCIDRGALAEAAQRDGASGGRPPESETERAVARLWEAVLNTTRVDAVSSFFDLGGDSLTAARLLNRIEKELECSVSIRVLFENPTIEGLAAAIERQRREHAREAFPLDVDALSPDEAEELLAALSAYDNAQS